MTSEQERLSSTRSKASTIKENSHKFNYIKVKNFSPSKLQKENEDRLPNGGSYLQHRPLTAQLKT